MNVVGENIELSHFTTYFKVREELEATTEIIENQDSVESILRGEEDLREGRVASSRKVREDV